MQRGSMKNRLLDYWLGTPLLNLCALFRPRRTPPVNPSRIGVMCSPALGDTLLFSAVLQDIRSAFPQAHIVHLCMRPNLAAAEIIPGADARLLVDLTNPLPSIRAIRAERLDVLLDFTSWQRLTAFLTLTSGAAFTTGFRTPGQHRGNAYDAAIEHRNDCHEVENFRRLLQGSGLLQASGVAAPHHEPAVQVPTVASLPFSEEADLIALHPWASGQRSWLREWPDARWIELAQHLTQTHPGGASTLFLVTGGPADQPRVLAFVEGLRAAGLRASPFVSPDGMVTLTHVLRRCRLVVSVNTGVMHLAAIAGAPVVGLSGPTNNLRWGPYGPHVAGIQASGPGCGYLNLGFEFDGQPTDCMDSITVPLVNAAAHQLLAETWSA